ncbi:hypothetical protein JTB14_024772 [Gonioctena quinquepunctata]|nr:hypothetical protein JTB14_024772 [Gonioctena quinquepunctata]
MPPQHLVLQRTPVTDITSRPAVNREEFHATDNDDILPRRVECCPADQRMQLFINGWRESSTCAAFHVDRQRTATQKTWKNDMRSSPEVMKFHKSGRSSEISEACSMSQQHRTQIFRTSSSELENTPAIVV